MCDNTYEDDVGSPIETIARGVCIVDGRLLLCKAKGAATSYLPGGHIEFGETGREALVREMREETGLRFKADGFLGVVENRFMQKGREHAEINLVYAMTADGAASEVRSQEDWIEFFWCPLDELASASILPTAFNKLAKGGLSVRFEP